MKIEKSKFQSKENIYMYDLKYRIILHIHQVHIPHKIFICKQQNQ